MKKKIFTILLILLVTNCGFTPIYNENNKIDYKINVTEVNGDKMINTKMLSEIKRISNLQSVNIINITIDTLYEKKIISKNMNGTASDYQLSVKTTFKVEQNNEMQEYSFQEDQIIKFISDFFEQKNYENTIKENFADSIVRKFNLKLISIQ